MSTGSACAVEIADLGRVVVTPYRYGEDVGKVAASVTVITAEDIKRSNAVRVVDVLRTVPGLTVKDYYSNGTKAAVDMAGFGEQGLLNVLALVDGRRINDVDLSGVDWSQVPLDQVERIEVIRGGAAGVLYGDNASSGVINIITKRGSGKPLVDLQTAYGSYAYNSQKMSVSGGVDNKFSYWFNGGRDSMNGYRDNAFNKSSDFSSKLGYDPTDLLTLRLEAGLHTGAYGMPGALWQNHIDEHGRRYSRYNDDMAKTGDYFIVLGGDAKDFGSGKLSTDISSRHKTTDSFFPSSGNPTRRNVIDTYGFTPKYVLNSSLFDHDNKLITGVDVYRSLYRSREYDRSDDNSLQSHTNVNKTSIAGYGQNEFSITDPLVLVGGYRYEAARYTFMYHDNNTTGWGHPYADQDAKVTPKKRALNSGLVYNYREGSSVFADAGTSFRFPEVDEFTFQDASYQQQLDTSLRPQTAIDYQVGVRHKFSDDLKGSVSLFRMNVKDELYYNATGGPALGGKNENYDKTVHQGLESSTEVKLTERISTIGSYSYTQAYFNEGIYNRNDIPSVPRHKASVGVRTALSKVVSWDIVDTYVGNRYALNDQANTQGRVNGYMVLDSSLSWRSGNIAATFGIRNLLDKQYSEMVGYGFNSSTLASDRFYYPSMGRSFDLSMEYKF